jgi:hypothetical protein
MRSGNLAPALLERVRTHLVALRMPRALEMLDHVVGQLERGEVSALEAMDALLAEEFTIRDGRRVKAALQMARLSTIKTLSGFDFSFQPSLDRNRILTLAQLDFIDRHEVIHVLGPPGTGKSHVSIAVPDPRPRGRRVEHHYLTRRSDRGSGSAPMRRCRTVAILSLGSGAVGVSSTESSPASRRRDEEARTRPGQARVKRLWRHDRLRIKHMAASPRISPASRRRTSWVSEQLASTSPSAAIMLPASSTMDAHTQSRSAFALRPTVSAA